MQLIIVESPTKAKTLSAFLGDDYVVLATMGHIKDLPKSKLSIDLENNFEPNYLPVEKRAQTVKEIVASAKKAKMIFIATDPDREGEAIAAHVAELFAKGKDSKRIEFHEITKEAVTTALNHPRKINVDLVNAQIARRVLDRLVGYKLSPLLWKKVRRGLSAGRVQTVAVRLIVEKEKEISAFKSDEYWEIYCHVKGVVLQLMKVKITNGQEAKKITAELEKAKYVVAEVKKREVNKSPYPPFTTSTMTQAAARLFGWSAKRTMRAAQVLYEKGLITYHRTDSLSLASSAIDAARKYIKSEYGDKYLPEKARFYKTNSKSAQEAHEAIRPTHVNKKIEDKLYELIWKRFVACQMPAATYDETVIIVNADKYELRASGQIMRFDGWRKLFKTSGEFIELPEVTKGQELKLIKVDPQQKFTEPPARFNEASLIRTLEKLGIGRPSTYAPIITTIQLRQYVEKKEGKFFATTIGVAVNDFLVPNFEQTFDYGFTAQMEEGLDKVAEGNKDWHKEIKSFYTPFAKLLKKVEKNSGRVKIETEKLDRKCPECKEGGLIIRHGRFGKFISCDRFPDCKYTEKIVEKLNMKCPECKIGEVIIKTSKRRSKFYGCSRYPDCKWASWKKPEVK